LEDAIIASRLTSDNYYDCEERAESYDKSEKIWIDGEKRATALDPDPSWSVLDIGSGPGILAVPLARRVRRVTVVEPSLPMIRCLKRHLDAERLSNVKIINALWEDISADDVGVHELAIASYSLNFQDIRDALQKMNCVATKKAYIYWFAGVTSWEQMRIDLFPQIYGRIYTPYPKINVLYNLLYDLGLYPDMEVLEGTSFAREYCNYHEAFSYLKSTLNVSDERFDGLLRRYIDERWKRNNGKLVMKDGTTYVRLSWKPKRIDE
jgi:ubiquinone/menaquinone biosynthesis C-methylase UbiE